MPDRTVASPSRIYSIARREITLKKLTRHIANAFGKQCKRNLCRWPHGVMVSTLDFESSDPSSNLGGTCPVTLLVSSFTFAPGWTHIHTTVLHSSITTPSSGFHICPPWSLRSRKIRYSPGCPSIHVSHLRPQFWVWLPSISNTCTRSGEIHSECEHRCLRLSWSICCLGYNSFFKLINVF